MKLSEIKKVIDKAFEKFGNAEMILISDVSKLTNITSIDLMNKKQIIISISDSGNNDDPVINNYSVDGSWNDGV